MNKSELKHLLRNTPCVSRAYRRVIDKIKGEKFRIESIPVIMAVKSNNNKPRLNLVLPAFEKDFVYGGITTTIKMLINIANHLNIESRIIVLKGSYSKKASYCVEGYNTEGDDPSLAFIDDLNKRILVRKEDIFIGTMWTTIYPLKNLFSFQKKEWKVLDRKFVYLIQDYEPGFYKWSTEFVLCENTYKENTDDIIAIFNAKSLFQYFKNNQYSFGEEYWFEPVINDVLKTKIGSSQCRKKREKIILLYGRPRNSRNAFDLIRFSLKEWSSRYKDAPNWRIISLGATFDDIRIERNTIECRGKVSLEEYADLMLNSYAAISLMISPHPSYPPLELSSFGVRTITNQFANKELSSFNKNIISLDNCSPKFIVKSLIDICEEYDEYESSFEINNNYFCGSSYNDTISEVSRSIEKLLTNKK